MPYQVTMDRTLSESEIDRLVQSELSRRQYNTALGHLSDEEFIAKWKEDLNSKQQQFPSGRFRNIRWQEPTVSKHGTMPRMNPEDPLGLEAHPTENTCPIIFSSFCYPCWHGIEPDNLMLSEEGTEFIPDPRFCWEASESISEQIQNDWEMNGQTGDFRTKLGITDQAMWNDNPATGESSADIIKRWSLLPHEKGFASDPDKISFVPMIEFFKSIGVSHHGYFILGQKPKEFTKMMKVGTENNKGVETINGKDRRESPSDFPWSWQYGMSDVTAGENVFITQYLNCEDDIVNGPEHIRDYGWPGTK